MEAVGSKHWAVIMIKKFSVVVLWVSLAGAGAGCSLGDYEQKFGESEKYLDYVQQENDHLGTPILIPQTHKVKEGENKPPPGAAIPGAAGGAVAAQDIFLRPPKGISSEGEEVGEDTKIYQYKKAESPAAPSTPAVPGAGGGNVPGAGGGNVPGAGGGNVPGAGGGGGGPAKSPPKESIIQEMYLGFLVSPDMEDFKNRFLGAIPVDRTTSKLDVHNLNIYGRPKSLTFDSFTDGNNPVGLIAYFFTSDVGTQKYNVGIAFKVDREKTQDAYFNNQVKYSLDSLAVGPDAAVRYKYYRPLRK